MTRQGLGIERYHELAAMQAEGLCIAEAARRIGISNVGVIRWLEHNGHSELRRALADNARYNAVRPEEARRRFEVIISNKTLEAAARELGITGSSLCHWMKKNAPDGAESALQDYLEDVEHG